MARHTWAQDSAVLWQEDFSSYSNDDVPSGGDYSYVCTNGGSTTKIYAENVAGGVAPELLVSKTGGTFTATIPLNNVEGDLTLTFTTNNQKIKVSTTTEGISGGLEEKLAGTHTCTFTGVTTSMNQIVIVFTGSGSSNVRLDDIQLVKGTPIVSSITVNPATVNATAEETDGTLAISYDNLDISSTASFGIQYYNASNEVIDEPDWIVTEVESEEAGVSYMISYIIDANEGEARTAYLKVYGYDAEENEIFSNLITINQAAPIVDYATLPFEFDGGKNDIENTNGLTQEGLGGDYNNSPKMKFDGTGDYLILKFNEQPGKLTFDVKGNTFSGGTFTVQTSEDGETYTDLATYTDTELVGTTVLDEEFNNLGEDVRYIKWIYTEKVGGNVALGNIMLTAYVAPVPYTLTVTPNDNADIFVFYNNAEYTEIESGSEVPAGSEVLVSVSASDGYALESVSVIDADGGEVELTEEEDGISYTFTMPSSDVTVSCTVTEYVQPEGIVFEKVTSTDDLVAGGEYIIVSSSMAMSTTQNNNNRGATEITISENKATINENTQVFTLEGSSDGWYFYTGSGYIYASSKSSNQLKTKTEKEDDAKAVISIDNNGNATITFQREGRNTLMFNNTNNPQIFSCYASDASQQPVQLYKKVVEEENITIGSAGYATYVTKKAIRFNENINAYAVLAIHETSVALDKLTEAPANTPIIVEGAEGEYPCTVIENAERPATNFLKVSTGVTGDGATIYALANKDQGVGFYPVGNGITIPAGKAYLEILPTMSVKGFLALGGLADAINNIAVETANGTIFNIAGQKVQNITKGGLYIVNGKKVFVK